MRVKQRYHIDKSGLFLPVNNLRHSFGYRILGFGGYARTAFSPISVAFDGTDYMSFTGQLTGGADSKVGIFSCWARFPTDNNTEQFYTADGNNIKFWKRGGAFDDVRVELQQLDMNSTVTTLTNNTWYHVLCAWDLGSSVEQMYINDVDENPNVGTSNNANVDWTYTLNLCGAGVGGDDPIEASMAEVYLNIAETLDISQAENRAKFISGGSPVDLGEDGSTPTGSQPIVYFSNRDADAASAFATNRGTGGDYSITGTLVEGSALP
jgi:hypothetical protein|tara:strand:+ start:744 stop:1541 length:798 start_codon:yes stop_codon:yes gene_type:complete